MITGEIKNMSLGLLSFDVTGPGIISIKWEEVKAFTSNKTFEIYLRNGSLLQGQIDSNFYVAHQITLDDIVKLTKIKDRILSRFSGNVNLGFNYTKSSDILQSNLSSTVYYRIPKLELGLSFNSVITHSGSDSSTSRKQDIIFNATRYFAKSLFVLGQLGWQENTELGLAHRFLLNGAVGKDLLVDNHNKFMAAAGLSLNSEQAVESNTAVGNVDGLVIVQYKRFYYSSPKVSLNTNLTFYPGFTDWGRIRTEFNLSTSVEVIKDFFVGLTFYDNFDNKPSAGAASNNDYSVSFTIGYSFGK